MRAKGREEEDLRSSEVAAARRWWERVRRTGGEVVAGEM